MKILMSGATGFLGTALARFLRACGHDVIPLVRSTRDDKDADDAPAARWCPQLSKIELPRDITLQAVVHLAGEPILGRWSRSRKLRIRSSRVDGTQLLCKALAELPTPPSVVISGSAIGFYGDHGGERVNEDSEGGHGFLADVVRDWEAATEPVANAGARVVHMRTGMVLSPDGGALGKMLLPFRCGLGGRLGTGNQFMSWIGLDDFQSAVLFALMQPTVSGPLNFVAPNPVTNTEFTRTLARVLRRPAWIPVPAKVLRMIMGEVADATLLSSARVLPSRLEASGFMFRFPELEPALRQLLGR